MAVPIRWRSEFVLNDSHSGDQFDSALAGTISGQFLTLFTDLAGNADVRARYFDATAVAPSGDFIVNDFRSLNQDSAAVAATGSGRLLAVWTDDSQTLGDASSSAIHAQVFTAAGVQTGVEILVNTAKPGSQLDPAVAGLTGNRFLVAWTDQGSGALRAQIVSDGGGKLGGEIVLRSGAGITPAEAAVTGLSSGGAFALWQERNTGAASLDPSDTGIVGRILDANGVSVAGPFLVNATAAGSQFAAKAAALSGGRIAVVWTDSSGTGGDANGLSIKARLFDADGTAATPEFRVNATTAGDQFEPVIAALPDGTFVVAWSDTSATAGDTSGQAVRARLFDADGLPASDEFVVNATTFQRQGEPSIAALADGRFVVSWSDDSGVYGNGCEIVGQIFDSRAAAVSLAGTALKDDYVGTGFDDQLAGRQGDDRLAGEAGNDTLTGGLGADRLDGGTGSDTADYGASAAAVTVNLASGTGNGGDAQGDVIVATENLTGSALADTLTGSSGVNTIDGGGGADTMAGGAGNDTYVVDNSLDKTTEGSNAGTDRAIASATFTLPNNVENLTLAAGSLVINGTGNTLANTILGNDAANTLNGKEGNDLLNGGLGDDTLLGGAGGDSLIGSFGTDVADYRAETAVSINLATGVNGLAASGDVLTSIERIQGSNTGNDTIAGGAAADTFFGNGGNDQLTGAAGNDTLIGGDGVDTLNGGDGADKLVGGTGGDTLTGGAGGDTLRFESLADSGTSGSSRDTLADFAGSAGGDVVDVSAVDAAAAIAGNQAFAFIGGAGFTAEGQIRAFQSGTATVLQFNTAGLADAEMAIVLSNFTASTLLASDFIL
jgi:hypothetical protein